MRSWCISLLLLGCSLAGFTQNMKMAAIGSSTTSGTGAFPYDSSWVGRFIHYYKNQLGIVSTVYNVGKPGATCYAGMPTSYSPPPFRELPDATSNVSKAVSLLEGMAIPANGVIIVNYPSNGYENIPIPEIMQSLQTIYDSATRLGNRCFITTTQPRTSGNFGMSSIKHKLAAIKDSIINRFTPANTINFWDGLFDPADSSILAAYSYGDGTHLNNDGHRVLFERVKAMNIFGQSLPLVLHQFTARAGENKVLLQWTVEQDGAEAVFSIDRSTDGKDFSTLDQLPARRQSGSYTYTYTDAAPPGGGAYYRIGIREVDRVVYSRVVRVASPLSVLQIGKLRTLPGQLQLELSSGHQQVAGITLVHAGGVAMQPLQYRLQQGANSLRIPLRQLPHGVYFVRISGPDFGMVTKAFAY